MQTPKHSDEDKARFRALVAEVPGTEVRPMFGTLAGFVDGHIFACVFGTDIGVKLDAAGLDELGAIEGTGPFGPESKRMKSYLSLPDRFTDDECLPWLVRARDHIASLPPKGTK